jgi:hypothetical protein
LSNGGRSNSGRDKSTAGGLQKLTTFHDVSPG